jgi:DNA repair exonuclease SbcCD ATPase subunit
MATRNENAHGTDDSTGNQTSAEENHALASTVSVEVSTPPADDNGNVDPEDREDEQISQLTELTDRLEALDTRISDALKDQRTWTTKTITSFQQELADLKATLKQMTDAIPTQVKELREELIRLSQELSRAASEPEAEITTEVTPPVVPPEGAESLSPEMQPETSSATEAAHNQTPQAPRKKRVI